MRKPADRVGITMMKDKKPQVCSYPKHPSSIHRRYDPKPE